MNSLNELSSLYDMYTIFFLQGVRPADLRTVWTDEARDFTPWLVKEENLRALSKAVGIELEFVATEKCIGGFRADILCKNNLDNSWVLIENQLEAADHKHLGQLLTYSACLEAKNIIWIASSFTKQHCATLNWLNQITDQRFNFFGVEIKLLEKNGVKFVDFLVVSKPTG
jgi:hypothetical protein